MIARHAAAGLALLCSLALAAPAVAAPSAPDPLSTHLRFDTVTWTAGGIAMSVTAPRGWAFVVTPEGQARFNAPVPPDVLTMSDRGEGSLRGQLSEQIAALRGTPGLHVLKMQVPGSGDTVTGELHYRWTPPGGEARLVEYRFRGDDVYEVAGRLVDRTGLDAVLETAADTGECS